MNKKTFLAIEIFFRGKQTFFSFSYRSEDEIELNVDDKVYVIEILFSSLQLKDSMNDRLFDRLITYIHDAVICQLPTGFQA